MIDVQAVAILQCQLGPKCLSSPAGGFVFVFVQGVTGYDHDRCCCPDLQGVPSRRDSVESLQGWAAMHLGSACRRTGADVHRGHYVYSFMVVEVDDVRDMVREDEETRDASI